MVCLGEDEQEGGEGAREQLVAGTELSLAYTAQANNRQHHLYVVSHVSSRQFFSIYLELADM